jgi:hypothetical protein
VTFIVGAARSTSGLPAGYDGGQLVLTKRLQRVDAYRPLCGDLHRGERDGYEDGSDAC